MSSPALNFVAVLYYDHFCILRHIRSSTFPYVNPSTVLRQRARAMRSRRPFLRAEPPNYRDAPPTRTPVPRAAAIILSVLRTSLVDYHPRTSNRVSRAAMERSLTRTRELCQLMPKPSFTYCNAAGCGNNARLTSYLLIYYS
ncbi:hypothetical protein BGY98DRAFT_223842 [Russula aff. rugulosa BPL654]|nr:hypothetical protein BGY98DRAFT_223842 [Russula aff. rugulosa BPL654]